MAHSCRARRASELPRPITPAFRFRFANTTTWHNCLLQEDRSNYDSDEHLPEENDEDPGWMHDYVLRLSASPPSSSSSSPRHDDRSEEHTSALQSLMRTSYAVLSFQKTTHPH